MANYQWRRYEIEYEKVWEGVYQDTREDSKYADFILISSYASDYDKCVVYTGYKINSNGYIELTNPKLAKHILPGDEIYGLFSSKTEPDTIHYVSAPDWIYVRNVTSITKFVIDVADRDRSFFSDDTGMPAQYYYRWYDSTASIIGRVYSNLKDEIPKQGAFVGTVTGPEGAYPRNGRSGNYWYVYDRALNQTPRVTGSNTQVGNVSKDFAIRYMVDDPDGDNVKVQIMLDDRVIQYPTYVPLKQEQVVNIRIDDYALGNHTIVVTATDSNNASATRTYYFTKSNQAPTISGSDLDLGGIFKDVDIEYIVQDADGDEVKVEIKLDGKILQAPTKTTLGIRRAYKLDIKKVDLGRHKLEVIATDSKGARTVRTYTFQKVNSAPVISGKDTNLGPKNTGFSYTYQVKDNENDNVKVVEKLNGNIIRTLYNATLGQDLVITITADQIKNFELHKVNTIEIEATDGTATVYRRISFTRNNMPPIISDVDKDLGSFDQKIFSYSYSATDPEKDKMFATVTMDNKLIQERKTIADGREQAISFSKADWLKIRPGKHTIRIQVEDDKGFKSMRIVTFTRTVGRAIAQLANKGIPTDEIATRVLVANTGAYVAKGAIIKYEVCNNSFDTKPTWEDATKMVLDNRAYTFQNKTKTASKAGINIRVTIEKGTSTGQSYISSIGGAFD